MNFFVKAEQDYLTERKIRKLMEQPLKELSQETKEEIRKSHWAFLDDLETILLPTAFFSAEEKYNILTDFQNKIGVKIEAEIYLKELTLNKKI